MWGHPFHWLNDGDVGTRPLDRESEDGRFDFPTLPQRARKDGAPSMAVRQAWAPRRAERRNDVKCLLKGTLMALGIVLGSAAHAQSKTLSVEVLNGKDGKPADNLHLLVFMGGSAKDVRLHKITVDLQTDNDGLATLALSPEGVQWLQFWPDDQTLCQADYNGTMFNVAEIMSTGIKATNTCGTPVKEAAVGHLTLFARPLTLKEKMRR